MKQAKHDADACEIRYKIYKDTFEKNRLLVGLGKGKGIDTSSDLRLLDVSEKNLAEAKAKLAAVRSKVAEEYRSGKRQLPAAPATGSTPSAQKSVEGPAASTESKSAEAPREVAGPTALPQTRPETSGVEKTPTNHSGADPISGSPSAEAGPTENGPVGPDSHEDSGASPASTATKTD